MKSHIILGENNETEQQRKAKRKPTTKDGLSHKAAGKSTKKAKISQESKPLENMSQKKQLNDKADVIRSIRLRTSPAQLCRVMTSMTPDQRQFVCDFGFGSLLGFNIESLPGKLVYYVVDNFDNKKMVIKTSVGDIKCDRQAVHDVFGIPMGSTDIFDLEPKPSADFVKEWIGQWEPGLKIRATDIADKITSNCDTGNLFKMNILMLFASTMARSQTNGSIEMDVLNRVSVV